jgi:general secretion pathway protein A
MYKELFGLQKDPFRLSPDPSFLFLTDQHRDAISGLTLAILQRKGLVVLSGNVGTGKTTLLARILQCLPASRLQFSMITNPTLTPSEFLELALLEFGITQVPSNKASRIVALLNVVLEGQRQGKVSVLIVDEAHKLSPEVLEEVRLLGSLEEAKERFLQIVLVGQPELEDNLNREETRQLKKRVGLRLTLSPLAPSEVGEYMRHRWLRAGGTELPFTAPAIEEIARVSQSTPRVINILSDNCLLCATAAQSLIVEDYHVREAAQSLNLMLSPPGDEPAPDSPPSIDPPPARLSSWTRLAGKLGRAPRQESKAMP